VLGQVFDGIVRDGEAAATPQPKEAIQAIFDVSIRPHNERTLPHDDAGQGSNILLYVELRGIEPLTFSLRTKRSTN
jgi:site-specific DNA recombinase